MQPYQEATEEIQRQGELPSTLARRAASLGAAAGGITAFGRGIAEKALALTSKFVPTALAIKGLTKLSPGLGRVIEKAVSEGKTEREALDFIASKAQEGVQEQEDGAKESTNIIEQYSPELHQFIAENIKKGRSALQAGALATLDKKSGQGFKKVIDKIVKEHKTPWVSILESVYGPQKSPQNQSSSQAQGGSETTSNDSQEKFKQELMALLNS